MAPKPPQQRCALQGNTPPGPREHPQGWGKWVTAHCDPPSLLPLPAPSPDPTKGRVGVKWRLPPPLSC